jgi:hypothetical protein
MSGQRWSESSSTFAGPFPTGCEQRQPPNPNLNIEDPVRTLHAQEYGC